MHLFLIYIVQIAYITFSVTTQVDRLKTVREKRILKPWRYSENS